MSKVTVRVTQEHIDAGVRHDPVACMVTLAVLDALGIEQNYVNGVLSNTDFITISDKRIPTPAVVAERMESFDDELPVQPFEFELEIEVVNEPDATGNA